MTSPETALAERMRGEITDLDRSVARVSAAWERGKRAADQDYYLDAVALNLHGFYSGIERLFELTARYLDLLCRMATPGTMSLLCKWREKCRLSARQ